MRIHVDNVPADKLRAELENYTPEKIIAVVVSRYIDGRAAFYQIIHWRR